MDKKLIPLLLLNIILIICFDELEQLTVLTAILTIAGSYCAIKIIADNLPDNN